MPKKKEVEKNWERGDYSDVFHNDCTVTCWKDNKPVYMASNVFQAEPTHPATRYSRIQIKGLLLVSTKNENGLFLLFLPRTLLSGMPDSVKQYNGGMGGVDMFDSMVACYRIRIRKKKWWWAIFSWSLTASAVNAWRLRNYVKKDMMPFLEFQRQLAMQLLTVHGTAR